jgi:hypothetical protein
MTASGSLTILADDWLRLKRWLLARMGETKEQRDHRQERNRRRRRRKTDVGRRARMFSPAGAARRASPELCQGRSR